MDLRIVLHLEYTWGGKDVCLLAKSDKLVQCIS